MREYLPMACLLQLLAAAKLRQSFAVTQAMLRSAVADGAILLNSIEAALLHGLYCPGLNALARGILHLDVMPGCLETEVLASCECLPTDSKPLQPFVDEISGGTVMYAWRILNDVDPIWMTLQKFLRSARDLHFQWLCPSNSDRHYFVAYFVFGTIRAALRFEHCSGVIVLD